MYHKNFFWTLNRVKYANYIFVISGIFLFFNLFFTTVMVSAEETPQSFSASDDLDRTVRIILQNSIRTIWEAQNYSTNLHCQADIMGKIFNGKGEFYQKCEIGSLNAQEKVSARWEFTFYMTGFRFYQLSVLNGDQERLWTLTERRADEEKNQDDSLGKVQVVNLSTVKTMVGQSPLEYPSIVPPWYSQPNVAQILEGILMSYQFTMAGETQLPGTNQPIYQIEGQLKQEFVWEVLESRGLDPAGGLFALPGEIPMCVELLIDKAQGLPILIRFYRMPSDEKKAQEPKETFSYTIRFEQTHLNDVSLDDSFFEISSGNEMIDVTEQYLKDHHN